MAWLCSFSSVQLFSGSGYTAPEEEEKCQEILIHICPKSSNELGSWQSLVWWLLGCQQFLASSGTENNVSQTLLKGCVRTVQSLALKKCQGRVPEKGNLAGVQPSAL